MLISRAKGPAVIPIVAFKVDDQKKKKSHQVNQVVHCHIVREQFDK